MPYDVYVLTEGNISTKVESVISEAFEDVENYDNSNYRDANDVQLHEDTAIVQNTLAAPVAPSTALDGEITVATFPNEKLSESVYIGTGGNGTLGTETTTLNNTPTLGTPYTNSVSVETTDTTVPYIQADAAKSYEITEVMHLDDIKAHIPPRNEMKKRTRLVFTCTDSTYFFWADQIIGTSSTQFNFVN